MSINKKCMNGSHADVFPYNVYEMIFVVSTYVNIPIADTGDCTEGVTVTVIGVLDNPLVILTTTSINPSDSEPVNCPEVNSTTSPF